MRFDVLYPDIATYRETLRQTTQKTPLISLWVPDNDKPTAGLKTPRALTEAGSCSVQHYLLK